MGQRCSSYRTINHTTKPHGTRTAHGAVTLRIERILVAPDDDAEDGITIVLAMLSTRLGADTQLPPVVALMPLLKIERAGIEIGMEGTTHMCIQGRQRGLSHSGKATTDGPMTEKVLGGSLEPCRARNVDNVDWWDGRKWDAQREQGLVAVKRRMGQPQYYMWVP
jgi:hypothetical protein